MMRRSSRPVREDADPETELKSARECAYHFLGYRARSQSEIEARLKKEGYLPVTVEQVVEELTASGYLDDAAFSKNWVQGRQEHRPRSRSMLRWELRGKGVSREISDEAVDGLTQDQEVSAARALVESRLLRADSLDPETRRRRLVGVLQRRGYNWATIREAMAGLDSSSTESSDDPVEGADDDST